MPMEIVPLKRKLSLRKTHRGSLVVYTGSLGDRPVVGIVTGIGGVLAAEGVEHLLERIEIEHLVVVGIAGALDSEAPIGALVTPSVVVNGTDGAVYRPTQLGGGKPTGTLWTSDDLITDPDVITRLRTEGVVALDMETAVIAEVCQRHHVPWSVVRAISDRATELSLDEEVIRLVNRDGTFNVKRIAAFFVRHPGRVRALVRLAKDAKLAAAHAAVAAINAVSQPARRPPFSPDA